MPKIPVSEADKSIGKRIQLRRKELGMTTLSFSEALELSQQQLSRYERGQNKINITHLVNIAAYTNTPISWFFIECFNDSQTIKLMENSANYHTVKDHELTERLEQVWSTLSTDRKQAIVLLLDSFSQTKFDN
jgi:transcriptional regulator with XRE-family HTH domain